MAFKVPAWVLWVQAGYSLWTFLRNAKFFRIPFIAVSMLWHGYSRTWFRQRRFLLMDGISRETGGDWQTYDTCEEKASHCFSIDNDYDMKFNLNGKSYRFCVSLETGKPLKFLHFAKHYHIVKEDIVLLGKYHLVKSVEPEEMLEYVLTGGTIRESEAFCMVDNTTSQLLNDNFMRILSILPLALRAKGFGDVSTLVSAILILMDIFSFYINNILQALKVFIFKYTKLFLARFSLKQRVFIHGLLAESDSFMYCDDSVKKSYFKTIDKFIVVRGCSIPLDSTTRKLSRDGDLSPHLEIKMNLNTFELNTEEVDPDIYNITITDNNGYRERREYLPRGMALELINYFKYCSESGNYPFLRLSKRSAHVINPIKAMVVGTYEWALTVQLNKPVSLLSYSLQTQLFPKRVAPFDRDIPCASKANGYT